MPLDIYLRILLVALARESIISVFNLTDFWIKRGGKKISVNSLILYCTYIATQYENNNIISQILFPFISNIELLNQYCNLLGRDSVSERLSIISIMFA